MADLPAKQAQYVAYAEKDSKARNIADSVDLLTSGLSTLTTRVDNINDLTETDIILDSGDAIIVLTHVGNKTSFVISGPSLESYIDTDVINLIIEADPLAEIPLTKLRLYKVIDMEVIEGVKNTTYFGITDMLINDSRYLIQLNCGFDPEGQSYTWVLRGTPYNAISVTSLDGYLTSLTLDDAPYNVPSVAYQHVISMSANITTADTTLITANYSINFKITLYTSSSTHFTYNSLADYLSNDFATYFSLYPCYSSFGSIRNDGTSLLNTILEGIYSSGSTNGIKAEAYVIKMSPGSYSLTSDLVTAATVDKTSFNYIAVTPINLA